MIIIVIIVILGSARFLMNHVVVHYFMDKLVGLKPMILVFQFIGAEFYCSGWELSYRVVWVEPIPADLILSD